MKRFIYYIAIFSLLLASCTDEDQLENPSAEKPRTTFRFTVDIPDYKPVLSRASTNENTLNDMRLLTFDADGLFIASRVRPCSSAITESEHFRLIYLIIRALSTSLPIMTNGTVLTNVPPCRKMKEN